MRQKKVHYLFLIGLVLFLIGTGIYRIFHRSTKKPLEARFATMGTRLALTTYPDNKRTNRAVNRAYQEIERLNSQYSTYIDSSLTSRVNRRAPRPVEVTTEFVRLLNQAKKLYRLTDQQFDLTVGPLVELWGFYRQKKHFPQKSKIEEARARVGLNKVHVNQQSVRLKKPGMKLDFGALVKGYAVDRAAQILREHGCENFLINLGGNIRAEGVNTKGNPWKIGLRDPRSPSTTNGEIQLRQGAVATSGDYEQMFIHNGKRYSHIINPQTGYPVQARAAVTVIARNALTADLYSTALFLTGLQPYYQKNNKIQGVLIANTTGKQLNYFLTPGFKDKLATPPDFDYNLKQ